MANYDLQKRFFENDPPRLATRLFRNPKYLRNVRIKLAFIAETFLDCSRILEVGTGHCPLLDFLLRRLPTAARYTGIDLVHDPLVRARQSISAADSERISFASAAAEALPFRDSSFDGVFFLDALHHVSSQTRALAEAGRVLRTGGTVVCIEPNPSYPVNLVYMRDPIERRMFELTRPNAIAWAREAGLLDARLVNLPIFFPGFPASLATLYEVCERVLGSVPCVRLMSTTLVLLARKP